jgi:hypothetical protein
MGMAGEGSDTINKELEMVSGDCGGDPQGKHR